MQSVGMPPTIAFTLAIGLIASAVIFVSVILWVITGTAQEAYHYDRANPKGRDD